MECFVWLKHGGLANAIGTQVQGAAWRRCQAPLSANVSAATPKAVHRRVRASFEVPDVETVPCCGLRSRARLRRRTSNSIERFNEEMRRRQRVIRIFPTSESALLLLGALLMEQDEGWTTGGRLPLQQSRWYLEEGRTWVLRRLQVARHRISAR